MEDEPQEPREWTEEEYLAGERTSDRMLGLWFLVIVGSATVSGFVSWATGLDAGVTALLVMGGCVGGFLMLASPRTRDLPPQRKAVRWDWFGRVGVLYPALALVGIFLALALIGLATR